MKLNPQFTYPKLEQVTDKVTGKRHYNYVGADGTCHSGMSSVTTILGETADKTALIAWRNRVGDAKANQESKEATGLGKLMHTHLENYALGIERPSGNNVVRVMAEQMADQIINNGLCNVDEVWAQEVSVFEPSLWAGSFDAAGIWKGKPAIIDYKTSKKIKKEEYVQDYYLQTACYGYTHNRMFGTNIRCAVIMMATRPDPTTGKEAEYAEYVIEGERFDYYVNEWFNRVEQYYKKIGK